VRTGLEPVLLQVGLLSPLRGLVLTI